jgi:hypothetical protein
MLTALAAPLGGGDHPLLAPLQSYKVLLHGLGRGVTDAGRLTRLIELVVPNLGQPNFLAALSSALSRPADAPKVLSDATVKLIAESTASILADLRSKKKFAVSVKYAMLVVGGLLRVRERDPYALLTSTSPAAQALATQLRSIFDLLNQYPPGPSKPTEKRSNVANLVEMLDGRGGNVGVLVEANSLDDEED